MSSDIDTEAIVGGCAIGGMFMVIMVAIFAYASFASGVVLSAYWAWFMLPVFPELPAIGICQAIGIGMVFSSLNGSLGKAIMEINKKKEEEADGIKQFMMFVMLFIAPWIALLVGYCFKSWFL